MAYIRYMAAIACVAGSIMFGSGITLFAYEVNRWLGMAVVGAWLILGSLIIERSTRG